MTTPPLGPAELRVLIDTYLAVASDTVIITNAELRRGTPGPIIQYVNAAAVRVTGRSAEELLGNPLAMLYPPEAFLQILEQLENVAESREPILYDTMTPDRRGNPIWLQINTVPIFDGKGRLLHFIQFGREITTRKRIEQQREVTQHLLASVFGLVDQALGVVDDSGRFSMLNTALTRQLGWSVFDLVGKPFTEVIETSCRTALTHELAAREDDAQTCRVATQLLNRNGTSVPGEIVATTIPQPDGKRYRLISFLPKPASGMTAPGAALQSAIRELLALQGSPASIIAGKVQLIGLAGAREALGERWHDASASVFALAERVLDRHLGPQDSSLRTADDGFLVCFAELSEAEAQNKAKVIAAEIREILTGMAPEMAAAGVAGFAAKISIDSSETASDKAMIQTLEGRLARERKRLETGALDALRGGLADAETIFQRVRTEANQMAPYTMTRLPKLLETSLDTLRALDRQDYGVEAELLLLTGAAERLLSELTANRTNSLIVPVRMSTLLHRRDAERWLQIARSIAKSSSRRLIVEITDLSRETARSRMTDLVMMVATLCRGVIYELPVADPAFVAGLPQAIQLVTIPAPRLSHDAGAGVPAAAVKLMKILQTRNCRLLVKAVASPTQALALAKSGISLILTQQDFVG